MSEQKGKRRLRAEPILLKKGYEPNVPEFSNLGTNELERRANEMKKATKYDEPDEEVKNENKVEESEDSALEHAFRNSIVERLNRLEANQSTMMTTINRVADRVKSLEEQRNEVSLNEEQITSIKNKVVELKLKDAL